MIIILLVERFTAPKAVFFSEAVFASRVIW